MPVRPRMRVRRFRPVKRGDEGVEGEQDSRGVDTRARADGNAWHKVAETPFAGMSRWSRTHVPA